MICSQIAKSESVMRSIGTAETIAASGISSWCSAAWNGLRTSAHSGSCRSTARTIEFSSQRRARVPQANKNVTRNGLTFGLDHLAFFPINIMIFIGKVLSLAINQEVWKCQRKSQ